jgi:hypothetical protein
MGNKGFSFLLKTLWENSIFLTRVLPVCSLHACIVLFVGVLLERTFLVTNAWFAMALKIYTTRYNWLKTGKCSWTAFGVQPRIRGGTFFV